MSQVRRFDIESFIAGFTRADVRTRRMVVRLLSEAADEEARALLVTALADKDPAVRRIATRALGHVNDPRFVDLFLNVMQDANRYVRATAVEVLGRLEDPRVEEPILCALDDPSWVVRSAAMVAVRNSRRLCAAVSAWEGEARQRLTSNLMNALRFGSIDARTAAALLVGELGVREAVPVLRSRLSRWQGDSHREVRSACRYAIKRLQHLATLPIAADAPPPTLETLPIPASPASPPTASLPRPVFSVYGPRPPVNAFAGSPTRSLLGWVVESLRRAVGEGDGS